MPITIPLLSHLRIPTAARRAAPESAAANRHRPRAARPTAGLLRFRSTLAAALIAGAGILAHAPGAEAQQNVRTRILDACVYDLYFQQRSSEKVTERCRCAAGKLASTVTPEEAASYRVGSRLTGTLRDKVYAALNGC